MRNVIRIKTLRLILAQPWYDLIEKGEKLEEYREIKEYYNSRFEGKVYDEVEFINGYHPNAKRMRLKIVNIKKAMSKVKYGGDRGWRCWVIYLGKRL